MAWSDIIADPEFQSQPAEVKTTVAKNYFDSRIAVGDFLTQPPEVQAEVKTNFYATLQDKVTDPDSLAGNAAAIAKTIATVPANVAEIGKSVVSGATLGLSDKAAELGSVLSDKLMRKLGIKQTTLSELVTGLQPTKSTTEIITGVKPEPLPELAKTGAEMVGAFAPISVLGKGVATGVNLAARALPASKIIKPAANIAGWAAGGAAYGAAEKAIKEGEAPTAESLSQDAAIWGGIEAVVTSLGWGGKLAFGVNRLAKAWGIPRTEAFSELMKQVKASDLPIADYARDYSKLQEGFSKMSASAAAGIKGEMNAAADDFLKRVETLVNDANITKDQQVGSYSDLTKQVGTKAANANAADGLSRMEHARSAKPFEEPLTILEGATPKEESLISVPESYAGPRTAAGELTPEAKALMDKPSFLWTAEDKILAQKLQQSGPSRTGVGEMPESLNPSIINAAGGEVPVVGTGYAGPRSASFQNKIQKLGTPNPEVLKKEEVQAAAEKKVPAIQIDGVVYPAQFDEKTHHMIFMRDPNFENAKEMISGWSLPDGSGFGKSHAFGLTAGIDIDKDGEIEYDPFKGSIGMAAGMTLYRRSRNLPQRIYPKNAAGEVAQMFDDTRAALKGRDAISAGRSWDVFQRAVLDVSAKAKDMVKSVNPQLGREIEMRRNAVAGANAEAARQFDNAYDKIWKPLTRDEREVLDEIISSDRAKAIDLYKIDEKGLPTVSHQRGITGTKFDFFLKNIQSVRNLTDAQIIKIKASANEYFAAQSSNLQQLFDNGVVNQGLFDFLKVHQYSPRKWLQYLDKFDKDISGRTLSAAESGIKALSEGSMGLMDIRSNLLLQQSMIRTQDVIARTKANNALLRMADEFPDNPVVRRAKITKRSELGVPDFEKPRIGEETISTIVNGQKVEMIVPSEFAKSWVKTDPLINAEFAKWLQWWSGSKIVKSVSTGMNPAFFLTNMPRDIGLVWSGEQYSKHLPIAVGQFAKDFVTTAKDAFTRKGRAVEYVKEGGGMEFLTYYGRIGHEIEGIKELEKVLGYVGETSEIWTRLAHRERALKNLKNEFMKRNGGPAAGKDLENLQFQATQIAREGGIDFSQGGNLVKALDNFIPYLNAGVQGTRVLARNAGKNPGVFAYKMAQLGTLGSTLYAWNRMNPEAWSQISDRDKEANFIVILPDVLPGVTSYKDDKGMTRYRYVKIAKDYGQRIFIAPFEALTEFVDTGKIPSKRVFMAVADAGLPYQIPAISAINALAGNVDDYRWEEIWKGARNIKASEEYRADTPDAFVKAGAITESIPFVPTLSPERMKTAFNKIVPNSNPFVSGIGSAIQLASGELDDTLKRKSMNQLLSENPSIRRILSSTVPSVAYSEKNREAALEANTENFSANRTLDDLTDVFLHTNKQEDGLKIQKFIESQSPSDQDRLITRYNEAYEMKDVPNRDYWLSLKRIPVDARAKRLIEEIRELKPEKRNEFLETADAIPGLVTDSVVEKIQELIAKGGK